MRPFLLLLCLLLFASAGITQPVSNPMKTDISATGKLKIVGKIIDEQSNNPLEFATISFFNIADASLIGGGLSELDGTFTAEIPDVPAYAVIEFIGYDAVTINPIQVENAVKKSKVVDMGNILISQSSLDLQEVEIRAEKSETQFSLDKRVFNVGKDLANRGGSAVDILDNVPSVTVDVDGEVSLRGSTGVRILVNGKRSGLGESLRNIPSNQIERIEVITNPSARYDAEGMAGIINIILKKDTRQGFNGSFDANIGSPFQSGLGANINYRKNKINWFAGYGFQYRESPGQGKQVNRFFKSDTTNITNLDKTYQRNGISNTLRLGMDYFFTDKTSLTASFRYQDSEQDNETVNLYDDYINSFPGNLVGSAIRTDDEVENESQLEYSLNFSKEFSSRDHVLKVSIDYEDELEVESSNFEELISVKGAPDRTLYQRSKNDEGQKEWVVQADYIHPFSKDHKIEFGVKGSFRDITNDYAVEEITGGEWRILDSISNNFIYNENIAAAYTQYGNTFGKFSFQLGLRYEYADITTELLQSMQRNQRNRGDFFPSAFFSYKVSEVDAMQISYSRRIRRPHFWHLNPFFTYNDRRNLFSGNPNLNPEYTDSYELNYLKFWDNTTLTAGLFYRHSTGVIERIRRIIEVDGIEVTQLKPENLAERNDYGLELSLSYSALKWLRLDASGNLFRSITNGTNLGESFENDTYTWTSKFTSRFTFWKGSDLQLRMNYRAPRETTQGKNKSMTSLDIGWSKDFLAKKNLTVTLSVRDVFNSRKRRYEQYGENFSTVGEHQWRARSVNLAFNYRINQKKQRQRPSGDFGGGEGF